MNHKQIALWTATLITVVASTNSAARSQNTTTPRENQPLNIKVDCRNPRTQFDLNFCAAEAAKSADRQLNQTYQRAIAKFKGTSQASQLVTAQSQWIKFRDADCAFERDRFKGGTIAPLIHAQCLTRLTQQRTKDLESYLRQDG